MFLIDDYKMTENRILNRNELESKSTGNQFVSVKRDPSAEMIEESRIDGKMDSMNNKLKINRSKNERRSRSSTTSTTPFIDFIDEQEFTESSTDYEQNSKASLNNLVDITTPMQITEEDKIQITINQSQNAFNSNRRPNDKVDNEVVIEHHHHLNYPTVKSNNHKKSDDSKEDHLLTKTTNSAINSRKQTDNRINKNQHHNHSMNSNSKNNQKISSKTKTSLDHAKENTIENKTEESINQFEPLDLESPTNKSDKKNENNERIYSSNIVIDGLPGFPDPSLYLDRAETNQIHRSSTNRTNVKLDLNGDHFELAADGSGFVVDSLDETERRIRESNSNDQKETNDNKSESSEEQIQKTSKTPIKEQIKIVKDNRFLVKDPSVIWATESDESAEEEESINKQNKINKSLPPIFYRRNLQQPNQPLVKQAIQSENQFDQRKSQQQNLRTDNERLPSIKFVTDTNGIKPKQLTNELPLLISMHNNRLMKSNQPRTSIGASNYLSFNNGFNSPTFRLDRIRNKRNIDKEKTDELINKNGENQRMYKIFSGLNQPLSLNQLKNRKFIDLETSPNEQKKPLKTSNYNYNNMNIYNPNEHKLKSDLDRSNRDDQMITNSPINDSNEEILKNKIKTKKKLKNQPPTPVRQPNFIEDNPFLNLFNTLTSIGQTSLNQALGQTISTNNNNKNDKKLISNRNSNDLNYQRASNENESSDDDELDGNLVSTEKPKKYSILGSGNYEILNGGIYKDTVKQKQSSKNSQPQQASFDSSDYSKENNLKKDNGQINNNSNLNNFTPFSFNDIPLLGFQGFDNFSKASNLNGHVIKKLKKN